MDAAAPNDPYELDRFVEAQATIYARALEEIRQGNKQSHWMWFIFPQIMGLGASPMAQRYAIKTLGEAQCYLGHAVLGPRYRACVEALQTLPHRNAEAVFGAVDARKLRSSLTLFSIASDETAFKDALDQWFGGVDPETVRRLH